MITTRRYSLVLVVFHLMGASLFASLEGQQAVTAQLATDFPGKNYTVVSAPAAALLQAVNEVINANLNNPSLLPQDIAAGALEPVDGKVRGDRSVTGPKLITGAVPLLLSGLTLNNLDTTGSNVALLTDAVLNVNASTLDPKKTLTEVGKANVAKAALAQLAMLSPTDPNLTAAQAAQTIANDIARETLSHVVDRIAYTRGALPGLLARVGIAADHAATGFVTGIGSAGLPTTPDIFASQIITKVKKNASIVAHVGNAVGILSGITDTQRVDIAAALLKVDPKAAVNIAQGVGASVLQGIADENLRRDFGAALTTRVPAQAAKIAAGLTVLDPGFAEVFTSSILSVNIASVRAGAAKVVGAVVGGISGDETAELANSVGALFEPVNGVPILKTSLAVAVTSALAKGGNVQNGGNRQMDLQVIAATMVSHLLAGMNSASLTSPLIATIANVAKAVAAADAAFAKKNGLQIVSDQIAGSVAEVVVNGLGAGNTTDPTTPGGKLIAAIQKAIQAIAPSTLDQAVHDAIVAAQNGQNFPTGPLNPGETPVTNF